jgi:hypothetical protein
MKFPAWQAATAVALILGATAAYAQGQQKSEEGKGAPPAAQTAPKSEAPKQRMDAEPKDKAGKGSAQSEPRDKATKGSQAEPKDKASKGPAQGEAKEQPGKGTAQTEPKEKSKGSAQTEPKDKAPKGAEKGTTPPAKSSESPKDTTSPKGGAAGAPPSGQRVQLSEQQRTTVHQTILKEQRVNRVTNVNFTINVGARVPRQVRLEVLPAAIFSIVPHYRSYRYFVVNDEICIVEPSTYEIVEVITVSGQTAGRDDRGGSARLVLSDEERMIVLREIDMRGGSTLGLGSLTEGADVPRNAELRSFPEAVVTQVAKLKGYRYFAAENRVGIVDPQGSKVQLVIEARH